MIRKAGMVTAALALLLALACCSTPSLPGGSRVKIYEKRLVLPTSEVGAPDPNPRFYAGRAYQGAQGRVYPYPMLDQLTDVRRDRPYRAVYLENEYIRVCVLPEIGGRVFEAYDKSNGYDFLYRQHVIKPALIGMLGAWISGGIEWNFPHHHRSRAFMPMDYELVENPDGSKTVWLTELDLRHRMGFTVGITLYPGRSYFEASIRINNSTPLVNSFLYWANPAVHANEEYQVIFPPGTQFAVYHGKNQFSRWPVSDGFYRGIDYTGVDISWWRNHPSPISFFAWNYTDDFLAGYDHGLEAGVAYVADHHVAPGKKFWEWGPGPQGRLWDSILTDEDGPYIELMAGAYTDNQPDYSWLQPYEGKRLEQYWYPIREMGGVKNATLEAAVNLEVTSGDTLLVGFNTTARYRDAMVRLESADGVIIEEMIDIDPGSPYLKQTVLPAEVDRTDLRASLTSASGEELVSYRPVETVEAPLPEVVTPPPPPGQVGTVEELYLAGRRLELFHNASLDARPYYTEALRRDPSDSRANTALGMILYREGRFIEAEERFRAALERVTHNYTSPKNGEAFYCLGLSLRGQGRRDEAYSEFARASWSQAYHSAACYQMAQIDCIRGDFESALDHLDRSLATNSWSRNALNLKTAVLRRLGRIESATGHARRVLAENPLDLRAQHELMLAAGEAGDRRGAARARRAVDARRAFVAELRREEKPWHDAWCWLEAQPFLEVAVEYCNSGLWEEAEGVLELLTDPGDGDEVNTYPMLYYYLGYISEKTGREEDAQTCYRLAAEMPHNYCFPFRLESIDVLKSACRSSREDARAHYYLGNLLYERTPEDAIEQWELAESMGEEFATLYRNLAFAYTQVEKDLAAAIASMERAVEADGSDPRLYYELDLLYEAGGVSPDIRLELLEENHDVVATHNDAFSREIILLTLTGRYDEAIGHMRANHFRRWEGLGNIHTTFVDAHLLRGLESIARGRYQDAVADFEAAQEYPANLEVARPYGGGRSAQIYFMTGTAYEAAGDETNAVDFYTRSATAERGAGRGVLDYYQGMAWLKLGDEEKAGELFAGLLEYAGGRMQSLDRDQSVEFFTKFGSRLSLEEQRAEALYLEGLALLGMGREGDARRAFREALARNPNHLWARAQLSNM